MGVLTLVLFKALNESDRGIKVRQKNVTKA